MPSKEKTALIFRRMNKSLEPWRTRPINPTCEHYLKQACGKPAMIAYPAWGGGWCALCMEHGEKHLPQASWISDLLRNGESLQSFVVI